MRLRRSHLGHSGLLIGLAGAKAGKAREYAAEPKRIAAVTRVYASVFLGKPPLCSARLAVDDPDREPWRQRLSEGQQAVAWSKFAHHLILGTAIAPAPRLLKAVVIDGTETGPVAGLAPNARLAPSTA